MKNKTILLLILSFFLCFNYFSQKPDIVVSTGHTNMVSSISISEDAKYIATGSIDKTIKIIETASGKELRTIAGNNQRVSLVKFDRNTEIIAAHIEGESLKTFDLRTGKTLVELPSSTYDFDFCLDNKYIVYIDNDNQLVVANYLTGESKLETNQIGILHLKTSGKEQNKVVVYDYKSNLKEIDLTTGVVTKEVQLFPEFKYATCRLAIDKEEKYIALAVDGAVNGKDGQVHVYDLKSFKKLGVLKGHESRIFDMIFSKTTGNLITTSHDGSTRIWNLEKMKLVNEFKEMYSSSFALESHPFEPYFLQGFMSKVEYKSESEGKVVKTFKSLGNRILNLAYDQIGNYLVSSGTNVSLKIWDLEQNKITRSIQGFWPIAFSPNGRDLVSMDNAIALAVWDPSTGEKMHSLPTDNELIQNISFNADGNLLAGAGFMGIVKIWDMKTHQLTKRLVGHQGGVYGTSFSQDGKLLASCGMDNTIRIWNVASGKELRKLEGHEIITSDVKFSPDGKYLASASWDKTVKIWNPNTGELIHTLKGHTNMITTIDFSSDGRFLASGAGNNSVAEADNSVIIWDVEKGTIHCRYEGHRGMIQKVIFDRISSYVFSTGDDGTIKVWDYQKCEEIATMASVGDEDFVIATPDNYYMSSKDALDAVSFRVGNKLYPFEQFDLKYNRPDIISSRLGKTPQGLVNAYQYLYQKRLRKMGFTEEQLGEDFHLPEVKILNDIKTITTDQQTHRFRVSLEDSKYLLNRINVYINNVPIYGIQGEDLTSLNTNKLEKEITVELSPGINKIQISVHNEKGVESLRETYKIVYKGAVSKGDLYIITIGVSEYKNEKFNLKYAAKDARDVAESITKNSTHLYRSIKQKILLNENAVKLNISEIKTFLKNANEEDAVIIFIAGHGVLDSDFDYYFAAHDMDFNNPKYFGVPYEDFERILSQTRAYQKLLIMDTCHSGELDKEEIEEDENQDTKDGEIEFRAVGVGVREKEAFGVENTNQLMDEMFRDVRKGTGATVISSAGGVEFAMESDAWKNGLFTYCLLEGLESKNADFNKDDEIRVSEIRAYVYDKVNKLSNGRQKPTARSENLIIDYRIR